MSDQSGPGAEPPSDGPQRRRRRRALWLVIGVVVVIVVVVIVVVAARPSSRPGGFPSRALGPSACVMPGRPVGGTGPWKLVIPRTLCGLPQNNSAQEQQTGQGLLSLTEDNLFGPLAVLPDVGNETSAFATSYNTPDRLGVYRYVNVLAFNGTFNPTAAVHALATSDENPDIPGNVFHSVPAGPHGGVMECAPSYTAEECVWATSTTLGDITIDDTSNELTGDHTDTNAIRIRDALEVRG